MDLKFTLIQVTLESTFSETLKKLTDMRLVLLSAPCGEDKDIIQGGRHKFVKEIPVAPSLHTAGRRMNDNNGVTA
jgi:hypothetical protein